MTIVKENLLNKQTTKKEVRMLEKEGGQNQTSKNWYAEAQSLARQIGTEEWKRGKTKYALEAWEASDMTVKDFFMYAEKLLKAEKLAKEAEAMKEKIDIPVGLVLSPSKEIQKEAAIKARGQIQEVYEKKIRELLGWEENVHISFYPKFRSKLRGAAVACLKMVDRRRMAWIMGDRARQ